MTTPATDLTLVLWDIDGTLIRESGASNTYYAEAVQRLIPTAVVRTPEQTSGGTDFRNLLGVLVDAGIPEDDAKLLVPAALFELERMTSAEQLVRERVVADGAVEILTALADADVLQSVVTGNSRARAMVKLETFGLEATLDLRFGGFGDRDLERWRLVNAARSVAGLIVAGDVDAISPEKTFVVGDTVHDLRAAQKAGAVAVGVASGPQSEVALSEVGPDLVIDNLKEGGGTLISRVCAP